MVIATYYLYFHKAKNTVSFIPPGHFRGGGDQGDDYFDYARGIEQKLIT